MAYKGLTKKTDKFILVIIIMMMSGASFLNDYDEFLIAIFAFLCAAMIIRKKRIDSLIIVVSVLWVSINIIAFLYNETSFNPSTFIGLFFWLLIPYFGLRLIGGTFWDKLESLIYKMALLTIPIFILNLILPEIFNSLKPIFEPLTSDTFYLKETQSDYWYSFFYTHSGREGIRNSGFMWEPGAFAMVLLLMIIYNWCTKGFKFNTRIIVYSLLIFTTFSTAGYLAFALLLISYLMKTRKMHVSIFSIIALVLFLSISSTLDFLGPKIDTFLNETQNNIIYEQGYTDRYEANRVSYFLINFAKSLELPTGYGIVEDRQSFFSVNKIVGVNGLGDILLMWGWLGFTFVLISTYKFCTIISAKKNSGYTIFLLGTAILITFFSNPIERNPILFLIIFTPYIITFKEHFYHSSSLKNDLNFKITKP